MGARKSFSSFFLSFFFFSFFFSQQMGKGVLFVCVFVCLLLVAPVGDFFFLQNYLSTLDFEVGR